MVDQNGQITSEVAYYPYGMTRYESNGEDVRYRFTGKELDETGLYYFGARYYDAKTSVWLSIDPMLEGYFPTGDKERNQELPGMGGVFNTVNLNLYHYAGWNPVKYIDSDGNEVILRGFATKTNVFAMEGPSSGYFGKGKLRALGGMIPTNAPEAFGVIIGARLGGLRGAIQGGVVANRLADHLNLETKHEHYFFNRSLGFNMGFRDANGGELFIIHETNRIDDFRKSGDLFRNDLISKAMGNIDPGGYCLRTNNCQHDAQNVRNEYDRLEKEWWREQYNRPEATIIIY